MSRRRRPLAVLVAFALLGLVLTACLPVYPDGKPVPKAPAPLQGFDTCSAPSLTQMNAWWTSSPYTSVGVYLPGASSVACAQANLTPSWVSSVTQQGWKLIPIWVGPQAPCTSFNSRLSADPALAYQAGLDEAFKAALQAYSLGMTTGPIYYDMEGYTRGGTCTQVVQQFLYGWTMGLHYWRHTAAVYSSLCSGIVDVAADPNSVTIDGVWIAAWAYNNQNDPALATYVPNLLGLTCASGPLPNTVWSNHQRLRQYRGGHNETWGGVTMNVDSNATDGLVYP